MKRRLNELRSRMKIFWAFPEKSFAFGVPMSGETKKDLYIFIFACSVGILFSIITGFPGTSPLYSAFLKEELRVSNTVFGILAALPYFAVIVQIPFAAYLRKNPKIKSFYIVFSLIMRINFIILGVVSYFAGSISRTALILFVLILQSITSVACWVGDLCFNVWLGAACPASCNGRFISTRQMVFTSAQLIYAFLLTLFLRKIGSSPEKYIILFSLAGIFGCLEILSFLFVREPKAKAEKEALRNSSFIRDFTAPFRNKSYRNYLFFAALWYFGNSVHGPFTNVFMNEYLKLPMSLQTLYASLLPGFATVLFIRLFGRINDRYGHRNTLLLFSGLASLSSLIWLFVSPRTHGLIVLCNFIWAVVGAATDMTLFSMGIYLAPENQRTNYVSVKTVFMHLVGIGPAIIIGGVIMDRLTPLLAEAELPFFFGQYVQPFHFITLLAVVLRLLAVLLFARRIEQDSELDFRGFVRALREGLRYRIRS